MVKHSPPWSYDANFFPETAWYCERPERETPGHCGESAGKSGGVPMVPRRKIEDMLRKKNVSGGCKDLTNCFIYLWHTGSLSEQTRTLRYLQRRDTCYTVNPKLPKTIKWADSLLLSSFFFSFNILLYRWTRHFTSRTWIFLSPFAVGVKSHRRSVLGVSGRHSSSRAWMICCHTGSQGHSGL